MADIKLTDDTWLDYEAGRVEGRLLVALSGSENKGGLPESELVEILKYAGLEYAPADLLLIRAKLIADEVIEIV